MSSTVIRSGIIALTTDQEQVAKLRNKLAEYEKRYSLQAPEVQPLETYKYRLLKDLLDDGALDVDEKEEEFRKNPWHRPTDYRQAVAIIVAYNDNDMSQVRGGTGLK